MMTSAMRMYSALALGDHLLIEYVNVSDDRDCRS